MAGVVACGSDSSKKARGGGDEDASAAGGAGGASGSGGAGGAGAAGSGGMAGQGGNPSGGTGGQAGTAGQAGAGGQAGVAGQGGADAGSDASDASADAAIDPMDFVTGLLVHYDFDGNVADQSGNGLDGTPNGSPTFVSGVGTEQALRFMNPQGGVAITEWVSLPSDPLLTDVGKGSFTIVVCYGSNDTAQQNGRLVGNGTPIVMDYNAAAHAHAHASLRDVLGAGRIIGRDAPATLFVTTNGALHCQALVLDRQRAVAAQYVDGMLSEEVDVTGFSDVATADLVIGASVAGDTFGARETNVEDFRLYDRALGMAALAAHFASVSP